MGKFNSIKLELMKRNQEDMEKFAEMIISYVKEAEKKTIEQEMKIIKRDYHIDHYFIMENEIKIGIVKAISGAYYYLGLPDDFPENKYDRIFGVIEETIGYWRTNRIEATLHSQYVPYAKKNDYITEFSRLKMRLDFKEVKNLHINPELEIRTYKKNDLESVIDMSGDAYRDSIDEQIGVFSVGLAHSAIQTILDGMYGEFQPNLSAVVAAPKSKYIEGASLTTISEGSPFVVLIGVRRAEQSKGIGRSLLSWVIKKSMEEDYKEIKLWVTEGNIGAINLYESVGFTEIHKIHSMYKIMNL